MQSLKTLTIGLALCSLTGASAFADWVKLDNKDVVQGEIISLDQEELRLKSENFGEMTIPRNKISIIGLGDAPAPQIQAAPAASAPRPQNQPNTEIPSLQNPQTQRLLQDLLGDGGFQGLQERFEQSQKGLKDLRKDMEGPSGEALDGYIRMFELFKQLAPRVDPSPSGQPPLNRNDNTVPNASRSPQDKTPANELEEQEHPNRK